MPIIHAWKLYEVNTSQEPVEFFIFPKLQNHVNFRREEAILKAKDHREATDPQAALTLFELNVSQGVFDQIISVNSVRRLSPEPVYNEIMRIGLRFHQFSETGHMAIGVVTGEYSGAFGTFSEMSSNLAEKNPKYPDSLARITEVDVPWYLRLARWMGNLWGFGWLGQWVQPKIDSLEQSHNSFEIEYPKVAAKAPIGQSTPLRPDNHPSPILSQGNGQGNQSVSTPVTDTIASVSPSPSPSSSDNDY